MLPSISAPALTLLSGITEHLGRPDARVDDAFIATGSYMARWVPEGPPLDRFLQARLAQLGAMRTAKNRVLEILGGPAGALGARAGRKLGASRAHGRLGEGRHSDVSHPYR